MQIGFMGPLGLLFIGLKLAGVITWSWLWVLAPFWIGIVLALLFWLCIMLLAALTVNKTRNRYHR